MKIVCVALLVTLFSSVFAGPTAIPFGGITAAAPSYSVGQLITQISDLISFSFYTLAVQPGGTGVTASVALWSGTAPSTVLASVPVTLSSASSYALVTATLNAALDPAETYVIYLTFQNSDPRQYLIATKNSATASGGYVDSIGGAWSSSTAKDIIFGVSTNNLLAVNPATNSAQGPSGSGWGCSFVTSFSAIQVDWSTLIVNTGYFASATTVNVRGGCALPPGGVPYATASECGYRSAYAYIDLSGTPYYVAETFTPNGYLPSGHIVSQSSNSQVWENYGTGDCGYLLSQSANAALPIVNEQGIIVDGGPYLQLARL